MKYEQGIMGNQFEVAKAEEVVNQTISFSLIVFSGY